MNQSDFLKVVLPFKDKIFRLAKRLLVSTEEAEDAVQELYFKLWKNKQKLADYRSVEVFTMTMTKNYQQKQTEAQYAQVKEALELLLVNLKKGDMAVTSLYTYENTVNKIFKSK